METTTGSGIPQQESLTGIPPKQPEFLHTRVDKLEESIGEIKQMIGILVKRGKEKRFEVSTASTFTHAQKREAFKTQSKHGMNAIRHLVKGGARMTPSRMRYVDNVCAEFEKLFGNDLRRPKSIPHADIMIFMQKHGIDVRADFMEIQKFLNRILPIAKKWPLIKTNRKAK